MMRNSALSDQLYNWTEIYETKIKFIPSSKEKSTLPTTLFHGTYILAGITYQTLQAMWKTWMQMSNWTRTRPQILSISQYAPYQARNDLCSSRSQRKSRSIFKKLSKGAPNSGRNLRNQPGALKAQRTFLGNGIHRYLTSSTTCCQYDARFFADRQRSYFNRGCMR